MDPANIYLHPPSQQQQQSWPTQLTSTPLNGTIPQGQTAGTAQVSPYLLHQRAANFTGSTSAASPYPSQTPTPQPTSNPAQSYYQYSSNGASATAAPNGTTIPTTFYAVPYYFSNSGSLSTGSLPISQYSSLTGATGQTPSSSSASSSTPTPVPASQPQMHIQQHNLQVNQPTPSQQSQQLQLGNPGSQMQTQSLSRNNSSQMTIDPNLVNPYAMYKLPYSPTMQSSTTTNVPSSSYQLQTTYNAHQFMQSPTVISPSQLSRSAHGYSNALANRPIPQTQSAPTPALQPAVIVQNTEPLSLVGPSSAPNGGLSPIYKEVLTPKTIDKSPEATASSIISLLTKSKWDDINCSTRVEILTKIRDNAGKEFYKVWARNSAAMEVLRDWLKATVTEEGWDDTLMPLLFIIDRLPLGVQELQASKIARVLIRVVKDPPNGAVKDLASNIESKWRKLVNDASKPRDDEGEWPTHRRAVIISADLVRFAETRAKKRKLEAPPLAKGGPPAKKPAVASASANKPATTVVKKVVTAAAKDSKADSSFFSSKPKPKLPSFRKTATTTAVKTEESDGATSQPSSIDPFAEAVKALHKSGSPAIAAAEAAAAAIASSLRESTPSSSSATPVSLGKNGQPKKRVSFASDDKLTLVKIIERAVYDDDVGEGAHHASYRDLDIDEGHALHAHLFEEQMDWYEPPEIEFPADTVDNLKRGTESTEIAAQEEREKSALEAVYMSTAQIPMTPSDLHPGMDGPPDESQTIIMLAGQELANVEQPPPPPATALQDLLAKIAVNPEDDSQHRNPANFGNFSIEGPNYQGYGQDMDTSWGEGGSYGDGLAGNNGDPQGWNGQGLPPPTGPAGFNEAWEPAPSGREPPTGPRRGTTRGGFRGSFRGGFRSDDWLPRDQIPCKFYNGPAGCIKGQDCPFRH